MSYFTPSQMSSEMLEAILVKRQNLALRLVDKTKQSVLKPTKHQTLLLGPRGMGKSHLVALVYHRVKALPELTEQIAIAYFAEEEWSITSLADLFLVILKALEREYGGLQDQIQALYRMPTPQIERAAGDLVRQFVGSRTLFILVENLDEIFRSLGNEGQWALRSFINQRPFVTFLASTPSLFGGVTEHDSAFYGFFQNIYLEELTVEEAAELLEKVARRRDDIALAAFLNTPMAKERVQAVHDLAGGHPRIYLLFAHLLSQETLDELVTPFLKLLDELTPYYQSRMQMLSPQQRKIVEFLCNARGAVTVKGIAEQNLMTSQTASGQLDKLEEMAYVRKKREGRESCYELREPLLRMVIEVKRGRGEPVRLIVDFLRRWYNRRERQDRLSVIPPHYPQSKRYLAASLNLKLAVHDAPNIERARRFSYEYADCIRARQFERASHLAAEIIESKGTAYTVDDWSEYAYCLCRTGQFTAAHEFWSEAAKCIPTNASEWRTRGVALENLGDPSAAVTSYDMALSLEQNDPLTWYVRGNALLSMGEYSPALMCYDKTLEIDPDNANPLRSREFTLGNTSDASAALTSFGRAQELESENADLWFNRGEALFRLNDYKSALASFERALEISPSFAPYWFRIADVHLAQGAWGECFKNIEHGFTLLSKEDKDFIRTTDLCRLLLQYKEFLGNINQLTRLYSDNQVLASLGQGVTKSIVTVLDRSTSQSVAENWRDAWEDARSAGTELDIPVRMLAAAVEWKKTRSVRALLALPIEERRILESMLPEPGAERAP